MEHDVYLKLLELEEKFQYLYTILLDKGLIKEETEEEKAPEGEDKS